MTGFSSAFRLLTFWPIQGRSAAGWLSRNDASLRFNMVSTLMRRVLVDAARARGADKRQRSRVCVTYDEDKIADRRAEPAVDVLALHEALTSLAAFDERKSRVVELRFFGGLSIQEAAEVLQVSVETVARDWRTAKIWLRREISSATSCGIDQARES